VVKQNYQINKQDFLALFIKEDQWTGVASIYRWYFSSGLLGLIGISKRKKVAQQITNQ